MKQRLTTLKAERDALEADPETSTEGEGVILVHPPGERGEAAVMAPHKMQFAPLSMETARARLANTTS